VGDQAPQGVVNLMCIGGGERAMRGRTYSQEMRDVGWEPVDATQLTSPDEGPLPLDASTFIPPTTRLASRQQFHMPAKVAPMANHGEDCAVNQWGPGLRNCCGMPVWVRLDRMQWGGKYLPIPCTFGHGIVIDCPDVHEVEDLHAPAMWGVDSGTQFGVQRIRDLDCELIQPRRQRQVAEDEHGPEEWAPLGEGATANQVPYRWSRGRGRDRRRGPTARGGAAVRGPGARVQDGHDAPAREPAVGPARREVGQGRRATASQRIQPTIFDPMSDNNDVEEDW
jgi:hypothetical protein